MPPVDSAPDNREFLISATPAVLDPVLAAIEADPAAELVTTGGARGTIDRLVVRLDPAGTMTVVAALDPHEPAPDTASGTDLGDGAATGSTAGTSLTGMSVADTGTGLSGTPATDTDIPPADAATGTDPTSAPAPAAGHAADMIAELVGSDVAIVEPNFPLHLNRGDDL